MKKKWYRPLLYRTGCVLQKTLLFLPYPVVLLIAKLLAKGIYCLLRKERNKTLTNLAYAYGETKSKKEMVQIAKGAFESLSISAWEFVWFPRFSKKKIKKIVNIVGKEKIDTILNERKTGAIVITGHLGNWELLAASLCYVEGYEGIVLGKEINYSGYNNFIVETRKSKNIYTYYRDRSMKGILRWLQSGKLVGILPDQDISGAEGIFVDFFNKPAYTVTGPAKIALSVHVPIIVMALVRKKDQYDLIIDEVIEPTIRDGATKKTAVRRITEEWSCALERIIRQYPEQWGWMHNRWKTQSEQKK